LTFKNMEIENKVDLRESFLFCSRFWTYKQIWDGLHL